MRIERLDLCRFGPFTDTVLGFGPTGGRLEIVFGPNEAGKSTALRAIRGLLYGIPERTRDAHVHPMNELRLAGRLVTADGRALEIERLKRRKNSLLDDKGSPLAEAALAPFLSGVGPSMFEQTFGLDAASLRQGAHALMEGEGEIGESLFDAGLGGAGVHQLLLDLEKEAADLYNPNVRAKKGALNQRLLALKEANDRLRNAITTPTAWIDQRKSLDELEERFGTLDARMQRLKAEQQRLQLATAVLPLLAEHKRLDAEQRALGDGPLLPTDARDRRQRSERALDAARRELVFHRETLASLRERRAALDVPTRLLELDAAVAAELRDRLGGHRTAERHLPERRSELAGVTSEISELVRRHGSSDAPPSPTDVEIAAVRRLERTHGALERAARDAERTVVELEARIESATKRASGLAPDSDSAGLERAIAVARRLGDVDAAIAAARDEVARRDRDAERALSTLAPYAGALDALATLPVPSDETLQKLEESTRALAAKVERAAEAAADSARRVARAERDLDRLSRVDSVPTEEELTEARRGRDEGFRTLRAAWKDGRADEALSRSFEDATRRADDVADRLRREADRVADFAAKSAERAAALAERAELERVSERLAAERGALDAAWNEAWAGVVERPLSPREMRGWLARRQKLVGDLDQLESARAKLRELLARRESALGGLGSLLGAAPNAGSEELAPVLGLAERTLAELLEARRTAKHLSESLAELGAELSVARDESDRARSAVAEWRAEWALCTKPLGLAASVTPEDVGRVLDTLAEIDKKRVEATRLERQIRGMERDARELEKNVGELVERHAPDLAGLPFAEAAQRLAELREQAARDAAAAEALDRQIETAEEAERATASDRARAEGELADLMARAGVEDLPALSRAEDRSDEVRRIDDGLARVRSRLDDLREGRSLEELAREVEGLEVVPARIRLQDIESERDELEEERRALRADIDSKNQWLEDHAASTAAIEAELLVQSLSAGARHELERYARLRLSIAVLRREIERYRELHQGPVLERANHLFRRLTDGHYSGLSPDVDTADRPVLRCVRANGDKVDVEGLSGGTRDQLYLALRLASLEHHATTVEPLPLVLDDVLVEFDDARARAALSVLGEVAPHFQVLLFTHHAHVVELAKSVLGGERLSVSELTRPGPVARVETVVRAQS